MRVTLLGGSNSILTDGFYLGLSEADDFRNLAVGASTCMQNLYAATANREFLASADIVITESNANDAPGVRELDIPTAFMLDQIDTYYRELVKINPNCIVIIVPVIRRSSNVEAQEIIDAVNERHRYNARKYGLFLIDLVEKLVTGAPKNLEWLIPDPRHPAPSYMYCLALNILRHFEKCADHLAMRRDQWRTGGSSFEVIAAETLGEVTPKRNSRFAVTCVTVDEAPLPVPDHYIGARLVGVASWCDNDCAIAIQSADKTVVKALNTLYAFNEIVEPLTIAAGCSVSAVTGPVEMATELSLNHVPKAAFAGPAKITGLLIGWPAPMTEPYTEKLAFEDLTYLAPRPEPFISGARFVAMQLRLLESKHFDIGALCDAAADLADRNPDLALSLFDMALVINPKNGAALKGAKALRKA